METIPLALDKTPLGDCFFQAVQMLTKQVWNKRSAVGQQLIVDESSKPISKSSRSSILAWLQFVPALYDSTMTIFVWRCQN